MVYVHCRSHALQLCLVKACSATPIIKRVVSVLTKLYSLFRGSHKRLNVLYNIENEIDKCSHKLVQPGDTRWLSHEASVDVVCLHYPAICLSLEHIYQDAGDLSSDAGGLLLTMRKDSTMFILALLTIVLKPLSRLSKSLQSGTDDIMSAMSHAKAVIADFKDLMTVDELARVYTRYNDMKAAAAAQNVIIQRDEAITEHVLKNTCKKYVELIVNNIETRFSDDVGKIAELQLTLKTKPEQANFADVARIFNLSSAELNYEWRILRRLEGDLSTIENLQNLATKPDKKALFPTFSIAARRILLLPIGTAGVERSFSTMNRIMCSERCRLLPDHVNYLMLISIEGPVIPDIRDGTAEEETQLASLTDKAYAIWQRKPHRI